MSVPGPSVKPFAILSLCLLVTTVALAQDTTGTIEGTVTDKTASAVAGAHVVARNTETGFTKEATAAADGFYRLLLLPVGQYTVTVSAPQFATLVRGPIQVNVSQTVRLNAQLELRSLAETVTVTGGAQLVDTSTNALGRIVSGRELVDLPLNGRNFTQLGLLQTGVAPLTAGVATAGGSLRQGQAYAVNGMRPEQNMYLVDGAQNVNRMDGGYALKLPVEAIAEFRILTQSAPPEYGGTGGATTSVVTRSGGNQFHGNLYEFLRNDQFDARNFFSEEVEPLKQNQFGGTAGGPIKKDRLLFFGYYEGFRNEQGTTTTATVPTAQERQGDFSGMGTPLINFAAGGVPIPGNQIPAAAINPVSRNVVNLYPLGNVSPSIYRATLVGNNVLDSAGGRLDFNLSPNDQIFGRYSYSGGHNINPISVRGTDVPGFPTRDDLSTHAATLSSTHIFSPSLTNLARATFLQHVFFFDQRLNQTPPSALGFGYASSNEVGQGPPFFNISGYTPIGGAITGPRNTTQNTFEVQDGLTWTKSSHLIKVGGEIRRTGIDMFQSIAPNAFFVFAGTFPTNNAMANLLLGAPVTFYQGLGDFGRQVSVWGLGAYAQDEWRLGPRVTLNYGLRYERINPFTEAEDRLNGFIPGMKSTVRPDAPVGLVFPGDPGIGSRHRAERQRLHAARRGRVGSDGPGRLVRTGELRPLLRPVPERLGHRVSGGDQRNAVGPVQSVQRRRSQLSESVPRTPGAGAQHVRPAVDGLRPRRGGTSPVGAELERERPALAPREVPRRGPLCGRGGREPPAQRRGQPCGVWSRRDGAERRPAAAVCQLPRRRGHLRFLDNRDAAQHHEVVLSRGPGEHLAPLQRRHRLQRVVLVFENLRLSVSDESLGGCRQAARRRKRPGAEPVRSGRRVRSVALRRATPLRRQRELAADDLRHARPPRCGRSSADGS